MEIKPIKTEADYQIALEEIEQLFDAVPDTPEGDRLEVLAILKELGSNRAIMETGLFAQGQIARAVELGIDEVRGAGDIDLVTADEVSRSYAQQLTRILSGSH